MERQRIEDSDFRVFIGKSKTEGRVLKTSESPELGKNFGLTVSSVRTTTNSLAIGTEWITKKSGLTLLKLN